jgi:hypothetical protein
VDYDRVIMQYGMKAIFFCLAEAVATIYFVLEVGAPRQIPSTFFCEDSSPQKIVFANISSGFDF